jgi:hypothetical protein
MSVYGPLGNDEKTEKNKKLIKSSMLENLKNFIVKASEKKISIEENIFDLDHLVLSLNDSNTKVFNTKKLKKSNICSVTINCTVGNIIKDLIKKHIDKANEIFNEAIKEVNIKEVNIEKEKFIKTIIEIKSKSEKTGNNNIICKIFTNNGIFNGVITTIDVFNKTFKVQFNEYNKDNVITYNFDINFKNLCIVANNDGNDEEIYEEKDKDPYCQSKFPHRRYV